jgi:gamma-glutamyl-gamma-aminobutyrate hydrolase PuuD
VVLVPTACDADDPAGALALIDGLIVSGGGGDVDPARYGAAVEPATRPVVAERDDYELALVRAAAEAAVPVLGICRGMQLVNVAFGGTLVQDLGEDGPGLHRGPPGEFADHAVRLAPGSLAARAVGTERTRVRSYHHQGVAEVAPALRASGWADDDGSVEALEDPDGRFLLGVLWHPEEDGESRVVASLVQAARERVSRS